MRKAAVICEFNPLHNGHIFLLKKMKSVYADEIVCIMSGSFVQRGDIAITDKYTRTRAALQNGADLVAELPTVYAAASARVFAASGVRLAYELGCDRLCFGAENSIEELYQVIAALDREDTQERIAALMKEGDYYPRAVSEALGAAAGEIISRPNNILAVEYIRACRQYGIEPIAIPRAGAEHDSGAISGGIASASAIREMIRRGEDCSALSPMHITRPARTEQIESAILYRLKTMSAAEIARLPEVSEGLENRIAEASKQYNSLSEILDELKTKRYTMARLRRIMMYALLGISGELQSCPVPYLRVLGVRQDKKHLITSRSLPLIVNVRGGYDRLDNSGKEIFDIDLKAAALMNIASGSAVNEFSHGIVLS